MRQPGFVSFLCFALSIGLAFEVCAETPPYRIAIILPLSGRAQSVGTSQRDGMQLRLQTLTEEERKRLLLIWEDDGSETKNAVSAYNRVIEKGVDVVISSMSNSGNALAPIAEQRRIPLIAMAFDKGISANRSFVYNFFTNVDEAARAAVEECRRRGYKRLSVAMTQHEGNIAMRAAFEQAAQGAFIANEPQSFLPQDSDFRSAIQILNREPADAIANFLHPSQAGLFAKQSKDLGLLLPQFSLGNFEDRFVVRASQGALQGEWYTGVDYSEDFLPSFRRSFPETSEFGASFGYDVIALLVEALHQNIPREELNAFIRRTDRRTGAARSFRFDGMGSFSFPMVIRVVSREAR